MSPWWQLWWLRAHDGERWWHAEDGRGQQKHLNCYLLYPPLDSLQNHWQQNSEEKILTSRRKFDMGGVPVPPWLWATSVPQHSTCPKWEKCVYLCVRVCVCVLGLEGTWFCLFGGGLSSGADLGAGFKFCCLFPTVGSAPECLSFHPDLFWLLHEMLSPGEILVRSSE